MIKPRSLPSHFELQAEAQTEELWRRKPTHILVNPSVSWTDNQCCLLHQWRVWPIQQQVIGAAKLVKHPILSIPQGHPSLLLREEPLPVFLQHPDVQLDPPKVFLQFAILHPGSEWITVMFSCVQVLQWRIGLLVLSHSSKRVQTCETWTMWITFLTFSIF